MIEIVRNIIKALNNIVPSSKEPIYSSLCSALEESPFIWRKDYTIALAKDNSKTKVVNIMLCKHLDEREQTFKVKREHDFWKKLDTREDYKAVVEFSSFSKDFDICKIESVGRDIMRSRKEVPAVALLGFIWVVRVDKHMDISKLMELYFKEKVDILESEESKYYIGWADKLKDVDMRHFICKPTMKTIKKKN
jgi:hypothetical protein